MGAMAQGKAPYDATEFALRAGRVAALTPMLAESYSPETQGVGGSKAKAELWSNRADFDAKMKDLVDRSATLATVAKGRRRGQDQGRVLRHGQRLQGLPRQVQGRLTVPRGGRAADAAAPPLGPAQ